MLIQGKALAECVSQSLLPSHSGACRDGWMVWKTPLSMTSFDHLRELRQWFHPLFTDMEAEAEREAIYPNSSGKKAGTWDLNLILESRVSSLAPCPRPP